MTSPFDPTRNDAVFDCPHCGVANCHHYQTHKSEYQTTRRFGASSGSATRSLVTATHYIYRCVHCDRQTYFLAHSWNPVYEGSGDVSTLPVVAQAGAELVLQFPVGSPASHDSVPLTVQAAADEAERCLAVQAPNACAVMVRRAVDALCQDKGAAGKDTYARLKGLRDQHAITPDLWEWAEELRVLGRSGAHPEWQEVTLEEADYGVRFLREILRYVYVNPSERSARRLKETKKKNAKAAESRESEERSEAT